MRKLLYRLIFLFVLFFLIYGIHRYFFLPRFAQNQLNYVNFNYFYNALASLVVLITLYVVSRFDKEFLGFALMVLGVVKLLVLVILMHYKGYILDRTVFVSLFLPYVLGQSLEIYALIQFFKFDKPQ